MMNRPAKEACDDEEKALTALFAKHKVTASQPLIKDIMTYFHTHP